MIDELDLAFDEQAERGKPRHRRGSRGKDGKVKSGGKSTVAFLIGAMEGRAGELGLAPASA